MAIVLHMGIYLLCEARQLHKLLKSLKFTTLLNILELVYEKSINHNHVKPLYDLDKETKQPELTLARRLNVNMKFHKGKVLINKTVSWLLQMNSLSFKN